MIAVWESDISATFLKLRLKCSTDAALSFWASYSITWPRIENTLKTFLVEMCGPFTSFHNDLPVRIPCLSSIRNEICPQFALKSQKRKISHPEKPIWVGTPFLWGINKTPTYRTLATQTAVKVSWVARFRVFTVGIICQFRIFYTVSPFEYLL